MNYILQQQKLVPVYDNYNNSQIACLSPGYYLRAWNKINYKTLYKL